MSLPSQRQLLTSLIASTATCPPLPDTPQTLEQRHLLFTLHVLFPTLLLPALDLIDRNLVARLTLSDSSTAAPASGLRGGRTGEERHQRREEATDSAGIYLVKSLASTVPARERQKRRHHDVLNAGASASTGTGGAGGGPPKRYLVRLDAWHCTCPSFTLDAFSPKIPRQQQQQQHQPRHDADKDSTAGQAVEAKEAKEAKLGTQFGGLSLDGTAQAGGAEDVPCCKHILACILAQTWKGHRGLSTEERIVSREEMAGVVANM